MNPELRIFPSAAAVAEAGAELFCELTAPAIGARGRSAVALSGGSTPRAMYERLARKPYRQRVDWGRLQLFWSDERAVPPDDPESNFHMASEALLQHVPVQAEQVHRMPAERRPLNDAADAYAAEIRRVLDGEQAGTPRFDLVLLGMGEDGHTASLFPETAALDVHDRLIAPNYVPKLAAYRLTFTPRLINAAANVLFLIQGADKADALAAVLEGPHQPRRYPSQLIAPRAGTLYWYVDEAAAAKLRGGRG